MLGSEKPGGTTEYGELLSVGEVGVLELAVEFFGLRLPLLFGYIGSYLLLRLPPFVVPAAMAAPTSRGSLSSGIPTASAEFSTWGDGSTSSASPRYRGTPSTPISTLGGFRKWVFSRYSGLMSRDASSG